jgi:hypothetical protein
MMGLKPSTSRQGRQASNIWQNELAQEEIELVADFHAPRMNLSKPRA